MNDSNWLAPQPNDEENEPATIIETPTATHESAHTVVAASPEKKSASAWSILAFVGGIAGVAGSCFSIIIAPYFFIQPLRSTTAMSNLMVSLVTVSGVALLGLPLAWYGWQKIRKAEHTTWKTDWFWIFAYAIIIVISLIVGQVTAIFLPLRWFSGLVGIAQFITTMLTALILLAIAMGGWDGFSKLRVWSHFISGAWLSVPVSLVLEIILMMVVGALVLGTVYFLSRTEFNEMLRLLQMFQRARTLSPALITTWISKPWVIALAFLMLSCLLPAIEELLKPIGVILMLRRAPTPMEAFMGGVLGGLGFAAIETLGNLTAVTNIWIITVIIRMGTMIMHAITSGIVGWGWGAVSRSKWNIVRSLATSILIHGLWNGAAVTIVLISLRFQDNFNNLQNVATSAVFLLLIGISLLLLVTLTLGGIAGLWGIGYRLRKNEAPA